MTTSRRKNQTPFKVGDKIVAKFDRSTVLTVLWVCKGNYTRNEQVIATERNGYCNPHSDAGCYEDAPR